VTVKKDKTAVRKTIFVVSGSTGRTCDGVLRAALAQFRHGDVQIVRHSRVRSSREIGPIVEDAAKRSAVIFHTLVSVPVRRTLLGACERLKVPVLDVLGPSLTLLQDHLGRKPQHRPGLAHQVQRERFDRIDAVDFTLAHDDGCGLADLDQADVVLAGISRVSKSVTCFFLAYRGIHAANVPLVPGVEPPRQLMSLPSRQVIGLTMNLRRLKSLRANRADALGDVAHGAYSDGRAIARELGWANQLIERQGWRSIDVSYLSVEEVAERICTMI
jgi:regulator of PEP synthase PpsR (kinase-PPPase family)